MVSKTIQLVAMVLVLLETSCVAEHFERHFSSPSALCKNNDECTHLHGNCCPNDSGKLLSCCDAFPKTCEKNPSCNALGLKGACCPTLQGTNLECCSDPEPSQTPTDFPSPIPSGLPSSLPTHLPSLFPTNPPSTLPSNLPSIFPTSPPTSTSDARSEQCLAPALDSCCPTSDVVFLDQVQECSLFLVLCGKDCMVG
mmetsp:Transcript_3945/g.10752  ORF Transcript_3945/g.10752 Transcript_3945/m.10752 type:complete len:197 (+) Transcript_3945:213-803(+)